MILKSIFVLLFYCYIGAGRAEAKGFILENSSPAIRGANVTFTVTVTNHTGELLKFAFYAGRYGYSGSVLTREQTFNHTVECKKEKYDAGSHGFMVRVFRQKYYNWMMIESAYTTFTLTETLNGGPKMIQRGEYLSTDYVYPYEPVYHYLEIPHEEHMFLEQEPTQRLYYWYINCALVEVTRDFCILHTYTDAQETSDLRVVLVVKKKSSTTTTTTAGPTSRRHYTWDDDQSSGTSPRPRPTTTERYTGWYNRGTSERTSRRHYNWDDDQSSETSPRPRPTTTERYNGWYNRGTSERTSRRHYNWDDDQSSETSPRPRPTTTERYNGWYNRGTSERTSRRHYNWDDDQSSETSPRPRPTTTERYNGWYNRGTSERTSRRHYNWDDDQSSETSPRPRPTTTERYNGWYNRGTSERTSRRHYNWGDDQSSGSSPRPRPTTTERYNRGTSERPSHRDYKRDVYNGHYNKRRFDNDQCMPDIDDDVFAYGVYQQTIHILDRNNPQTTSTTSTTTSEPVIIIEPKWPTTTDKDQNTNCTILNSTLTGNVPPFSISTILSQKEFPKNIHIRGILNMILNGSFNFEYSET